MSFDRRKIVRLLVRRGFRVLRDTGPNTVYADDAGNQPSVPRHTKVERGTARSIARQAGIEWTLFQQEVR